MKADNFTLSRDNLLVKDIVFIDGVGRTGKAMFGQLLSTLERVEMVRFDREFDYVPHLYRLEKITYDAAKTMLQIAADTCLYNLMIGRNVNYRYTDSSGVFQTGFPNTYFHRSTLPEGPEVARRVEEERPVLQELVHDGIKMSQFFFDAFSEALKIVYMYRDPVDTVYEWARRDFGERIGTDPTELQLTYDWETKSGDRQTVPILAYGWEDEYLALSPMDRIVGMINYSFTSNLESYVRLPTDLKQRIFIVSFDQFVRDPWPILRQVATFLQTESTDQTERVLRRERCPRIVDPKQRQERLEDILRQIRSDEYRTTFRDLCHKFEQNHYNLKLTPFRPKM